MVEEVHQGLDPLRHQTLRSPPGASHQVTRQGRQEVLLAVVAVSPPDRRQRVSLHPLAEAGLPRAYSGSSAGKRSS